MSCIWRNEGFPSHEEKGWKGIEGRRNTMYSGTEVGKDVVGLTESSSWVKKQGRKKRIWTG